MRKFFSGWRRVFEKWKPLRCKKGSAPVVIPPSIIEKLHHPLSLTDYLERQQNPVGNIVKLHRVMAMPHVILEIGCGACEAAFEIARKNPDRGVIATDKYAWEASHTRGSHYQKVALAWKDERLEGQQNLPDNLVILRAGAEILRYIPDGSIDTVLLVNPEPLAGQAFLALLSEAALHAKIKPGARQLVVAPFSREMGVATCGGYEFEHENDWSMGLGFLMSSGFEFKRTDRVQWGIDLRSYSPYNKNSTQTNVYQYGNEPSR